MSKKIARGMAATVALVVGLAAPAGSACGGRKPGWWISFAN